MVWFKVDDGFASHPKTVAAGNMAIGLWVRAGSWSAHHLTDGYIPAHVLSTLGGTKKHAEQLVKVGLWESVDDGYRFHQWNDDGRQPTRADVEAQRVAQRERKARSRAKGLESMNGDHLL